MEGVVLTLDTGMLDQVAGISLQTGHSTADVLVDLDDLFDGGSLEEGGCDPLLNTQDDTF